MSRLIIEIKDLTCRFSDGTVALEKIRLEVERGSFVVIAGENGSGKTTLLQHINGLVVSREGVVQVDGQSVTGDPMRARQKVGMVFQDADSQIVGETVYDDVAFGPENLGLDPGEIEERVRGALSVVGLQHLARQRPFVLSGGEKRRLAIAGVLAMEPEVILLDEPFANLDYSGLRQVLEKIVLLHKKGHTIIFTTHDLEKIIAHADRLVLLKNGKIVLDGDPGRVIRETEQYGIRQPCAVRLGMEVSSWLL
jgi:biotin transport system ATP-binding protein